MKTKLLLCLTIFTCSLQLLAQAQAPDLAKAIVGTWKMTSQTGKDQNGKPFTIDLTKDTQYKIINPTHWMYVGYNSDSLKGGGNGGVYVLKGNKYVETLDMAKTDFTVKVEGDKFHQDGFIIFPDGKKVELHEEYTRVNEPTNLNTDLVGTWNRISAYDIKEGKKIPVTGITELQLITPTHYMWVTKKDGKMEAAMVGTYTKKGNNIIPNPIIASFPVGNGEKVEINLTDLKPDQMTTTGKITFKDGKTEEWGATYQRVGKPKLNRVVSK